MWRLPGIVLGYVLAVELTALAAIGASLYWQRNADPADLTRLVVLIACALAYLEASKGIERQRRRYGVDLHVHVDAVWTFAAALLLPVSYSAVLVLLIALRAASRVPGEPRYKRPFNAAVVVLSCTAVSGLLAVVGPSATIGAATGFFGSAVVILAVAVYFVANAVLVGVVIVLANPGSGLGPAVGGWADNSLALVSLCLGVVTALSLAVQPWLVLFIPPTLYMLHRNVLIAQLETVARTDVKTGLLNATAWHEAAQQELRRAQRQRSGLGVLMIDLDHFKQVNDTYGHLLGDEVLCEVADVLEVVVRDDDLVGRFGGEEYVVCLPDSTWDQTVRIAERIRLRVAGLAVVSGGQRIRGLTVSIGIAVHPHHGDDLDELLAAADNAVYAAKNAGRDRVHVAYSTPPHQPDPAVKPDPAVETP